MLGERHPGAGKLTNVQLQFDEDEDDRYFDTRDALLDEIGASLLADGRTPSDIADVVGSMTVLLDWRWNYSTGQLDDWSRGDVREFLVEWLPRKYSAAPEAGAEMCSAVADFFLHMGTRERLTGGVDRAAALVALAYELSDDVVEAMRNPANFGLAKSIFAGGPENPLSELGALIESGADLDDAALQALLQERMNEFNALPFEQRKAITDRSLSTPAPPRIRIPVVDIVPTTSELEQSIDASRLMRMIDGLVGFVGTKGISVTSTGNLRLADARELVTLLGTDDIFERVLPWNVEPEPVRTSADLHQLTLVFDVAEGAGAFVRLKTKVKVDPDWVKRARSERAQLVVDALLDLGPVSSSARYEIFRQIASLLEDGIPHWLSMALPVGARIGTEPYVDQAVSMLDQFMPQRPLLFSNQDSFVRSVSRQLFEVFSVLDLAGIVEWGDRVEETNEFGRNFQRGGWFELTPLGRHTMVAHIRAAGYDFPTIADLAEADAEDLVNAVLTTGVDIHDLLPRWRPDWSTGERATALVGVAMNAELAEQRLTVMKLLGLLEPVAHVEPAVRQMLDSNCSGHASMFLLQRGLANPQEIGDFIDVGPLVDLLATVLDSPDVLAGLFAETYSKSDVDLLDELWRHDRAETVQILDILGKHSADKALAKAARKAAMKHRSWMANRYR